MDKSEEIRLELAENVLRSMLSTLGPKTFAIALNNASCHGDCFDNDEFADVLDDDDKFIAAWFVGIDALHDAVKNHTEL